MKTNEELISDVYAMRDTMGMPLEMQEILIDIIERLQEPALPKEQNKLKLGQIDVVLDETVPDGCVKVVPGKQEQLMLIKQPVFISIKPGGMASISYTTPFDPLARWLAYDPATNRIIDVTEQANAE